MTRDQETQMFGSFSDLLTWRANDPQHYSRWTLRIFRRFGVWV